MKFAPVYEDIASKYAAERVTFTSVDGGKAPDVFRHADVEGIPHTRLYLDGKVLHSTAARLTCYGMSSRVREKCEYSLDYKL